MPTIGQDLTRLAKLKDEESQLKDRYERKSRERKQYEARCLERMEAEEVEQYKTRGKLFVPSRKQYATIQDRSAFVAWALENAPDLVQYKERAAELNTLIRAALDDNNELPPGVGFYSRDNVSVRKA